MNATLEGSSTLSPMDLSMTRSKAIVIFSASGPSPRSSACR